MHKNSTFLKGNLYLSGRGNISKEPQTGHLTPVNVGNSNKFMD